MAVGTRPIESIAVVGAGLAGLACARRLHDAGLRVVVLDKGRGLGGRMATRRAGDLSFDHGAQYFTVRGPAFRREVEAWIARGVAAAWLDGDGFVGTPGMTAPARALADGLHVVSNCEVKALERDASGWLVRDASGPLTVAGLSRFDAAVLAMPSPQAVPLASAAGADFDLAAVRRARYAPCWAVMAAFAAPTGLADRIERSSGPLRWVARNASKPGRGPQETIVLHASPEWSRAYLEREPQWVADALMLELHATTGLDQRPVSAVAHRWRYALVEEPAGQAFVWGAASRLGACGDWCIAPRVEAAWDSGSALAEEILHTRENGT